MDNVGLFKEAIKLGILPSKIVSIVKELEEENGNIKIQAIPPYIRRRNALPIDYKSYKNGEIRIRIIWNDQQN